MKIAFLIDSMKNSGGRERVISLLSKEFNKNYATEIIVFDDCNESFYDLDSSTKITTLNKGESHNIFEKIISNIKLIFKLRKHLNNSDIDIVMSLSMRYLNLFVGIATIFSNKKFIATEHCDYYNTPKIFRLIKRIIYKKFECVVTLTEKDRLIYSRYLKNTQCIKNPVSFYPKEKANMTNKTVLNVGRLTLQKGQDMLLDIWKKVNDKDWKLIIVGDGELKDELNRGIEEKGLKDTVSIIEPSKEIIEKYMSASIFVMTSRWEGLPMVLLEAMACGLPCISFDCETGPREIIVDNYNGWLVKPDHIDGFAEKLSKLMSEEKLREQFSENAKKTASQYLISEISIRWHEVFEKLV